MPCRTFHSERMIDNKHAGTHRPFPPPLRNAALLPKEIPNEPRTFAPRVPYFAVTACSGMRRQQVCSQQALLYATPEAQSASPFGLTCKRTRILHHLSSFPVGWRVVVLSLCVWLTTASRLRQLKNTKVASFVVAGLFRPNHKQRRSKANQGTNCVRACTALCFVAASLLLMQRLSRPHQSRYCAL